MKHSFFFLALMTFISCSSNHPYQTRWHWEDGTIVVETPSMPKGQQTAIQLATAPIDTVHIGFAGLGMRGVAAVERYIWIAGTEVTALCDYHPERAEACQTILEEGGKQRAAVYSGEDGYQAMCERADIDLIYIATDWEHHFPIAKYALEHGKHVAIEVPSAMNLSQIWQLIDLVEQHRVHCIILENCCYDWYEMTTLNMAQAGVFGEIIYAEGAYIHCLDPFWGGYWHNPTDNPDSLNWRLKYNLTHRGDVYPTHGLGPIAQVMNIHRGDRMKTLVAMDTRSIHGKALVEEQTGRKCEQFRNGDFTTTLIRTKQEKVIEIQHNVMTPRPYDRKYALTGTKGYAVKYPVEHYAIFNPAEEDSVKSQDDLSGHEFLSETAQAALVARYEHPILKEYGEMAQEVGGHGGMDFIMDCRLIYCLHHGLPMDVDVYDLAEWCCLAELGALSLDHNSAAVTIPDFTRGHWNEVQGYRHAMAE